MSSTSPTSIAQLLLYPAGERRHWDVHQLADFLEGIGFLGEAIQPDRRYMIGERFLSQVSFLGCSPAIELTPKAPGQPAALTDFTHVYLSPVFEPPRFVFDPQLARPICPSCGQRIQDWQARRDGDELQCPQCQHRASLERFRWRRNAARASLFISVLNVFVREAIPTEGLLQQLGHETGVTWDYAYCQCPLVS